MTTVIQIIHSLAAFTDVIRHTSVRAITFTINVTPKSINASQFGEASTGVYTGSLIELALILFGVTLIVNVIARTLVWRMTSVKAAKE